jgi:adenine C2-methylase RlmN of 23S rRNA A2503 and tRNA A37
MSKETKNKIRNKAVGRFHTYDTKQSMSKNRMGENNSNSKITCQFRLDMTLVDVWRYADQLAQKLDVCHSMVSLACMGRRKTAGGFVCKYLYDYTRKDGLVVPGAITLGLITEEEALKMLKI